LGRANNRFSDGCHGGKIAEIAGESNEIGRYSTAGLPAFRASDRLGA
jgi:hypothetical protein